MGKVSNLDIELDELIGQAMSKGAKSFNDVKAYVNKNKTYKLIPATWIEDKYKEILGENK